MGEHEDIVRAAIARKYGSIPRMASETGIAKNTIYHALERGLDNTTTKTRNAILEPLFGEPGIQYYSVPMGGMVDDDMTTPDESALLSSYRALDARDKERLLEIARVMAGGR